MRSSRTLSHWIRAVSLVMCSAMPTQAQESGTADVARALLEAFNEHDPAAMARLVTSDFELFYMGEDGSAALALRGPDALRDEMTRYFAARPSVRSEFGQAIGGDRFVAFREHIVGGESSVVVYEIDGERLRRAWYYPAEAGNGGASGHEWLHTATIESSTIHRYGSNSSGVRPSVFAATRLRPPVPPRQPTSGRAPAPATSRR